MLSHHADSPPEQASVQKQYQQKILHIEHIAHHHEVVSVSDRRSGTQYIVYPSLDAACTSMQ